MIAIYGSQRVIVSSGYSRYFSGTRHCEFSSTYRIVGNGGGIELPGTSPEIELYFAGTCGSGSSTHCKSKTGFATDCRLGYQTSSRYSDTASTIGISAGGSEDGDQSSQAFVLVGEDCNILTVFQIHLHFIHPCCNKSIAACNRTVAGAGWLQVGSSNGCGIGRPGCSVC